MGAIDQLKWIRQKLVQNTMGHPVVFHHIPKCGGTSVGRALRKKYILSQTTVKPEESFRAFAAFTGRTDRDQLLVDVLDLREQMLLYWLFDDVRCVSAHVRFSEKAYALFKDRYKFITILRDPVDRFISNYFWHAGRPEETAYINEDFAAFLDTQRARRLGASYVEYFSGLPKESDITAPSAIEAAIGNLAKFDVIGRLDRLRDFRDQINEQIGVRLRIGHENKMKQSSKTKAKVVTDALRERARIVCAPDIAVWQAANARYFADKLGAEKTPSLQEVKLASTN